MGASRIDAFVGECLLERFLDDACALPLVLWVYRFVGLRSFEGPATAGEILSHGLLWAFMAEGLAPELFPHSVRDPWDVLAYFLGGLLLILHGLKGRHSTHHALTGV